MLWWLSVQQTQKIYYNKENRLRSKLGCEVVSDIGTVNVDVWESCNRVFLTVKIKPKVKANQKGVTGTAGGEFDWQLHCMSYGPLGPWAPDAVGDPNTIRNHKHLKDCTDEHCIYQQKHMKSYKVVLP